MALQTPFLSGITTDGSVSVGGALTFTSAGTASTTTAIIYADASAGNIISSVITGKSFSWRINGVSQATLGLGGITSFAATASALTVANLQIIGTATGLFTNVPTGSACNTYVNGVLNLAVNYYNANVTVGGFGIGLYCNLGIAQSGIVGNGNDIRLNTTTGSSYYFNSNGATFIQLVNNGLFFASGVSSVFSANLGIGSETANCFTINVLSGGTIFAKVAAVTQMGIGLGGITSFASGLGTVNASSIQLLSDSAGSLSMQLLTGGAFSVKINAVTQMMVGLGGITAFGYALGTTLAGNTSILSDATGSMASNVPTGTTFTWKINAVTQATLNTSNLTLVGAVAPLGVVFSSASAAGVTYLGNSIALYSLTANTLNINAPSGGSVVVGIGNVAQATFGLGGITAFGYALGTTLAGNTSILSDATGSMASNVPTGTTFTWKINAVTQATVNSTGLTLIGSLGTNTISSIGGGILSFSGGGINPNGTSVQLLYQHTGSLSACVPTGGLFYVSVNAVDQITLGLGGITSFTNGTGTTVASNFSILSDAANALSLNCLGGGAFNVKINAVTQMTVGLGGITSFASAAGTTVAGNLSILSDAGNQLSYNTPGGPHVFRISGTSYFSVNSNTVGIGTSTTWSPGPGGSVVAGNNQIFCLNSSFNFNGASGFSHVFSINGVTQTALSLGGITSFASGLGTVNASLIQLLSDSAGSLSMQLLTGGAFSVKINAVTQMTLGLGGITSFASAAGTTVAGNLSILSDGTGYLSANVPTGGVFNVKVNATTVASFGSTGLTITGTAATDGPTASANLVNAANWTTTGWTGAGPYTHTVGNTTALSNTLAGVVGTKYTQVVTITARTAGSVVVGFGGNTTSALTVTGTAYFQSTTTGALTVTPTTDFDGTVAVTVQSYVAASSPTLYLVDSAGSGEVQMRCPVGSLSTYVGFGSGGFAVGGQLRSVSLGYNALANQLNGFYNSAGGYSSLGSLTSGTRNSAWGYQSGVNITTSADCCAFGYLGLGQLTTGAGNVAFGSAAGYNGSVSLQTLSYCSFFGYGANSSVDGVTNSTAIGLNAQVTASNQIQLGNASVSAVNTSGKIGNTNAANPVQFAIPTPVAVATVTATAIPGLTTTFRGTIEVYGSDGSYGRFALPIGSTTAILVYGSATVSGGIPASTKWGIDYSSGWRYNNQTAGALTFTLIEVLTGIA